ncbi:MAG: hypothetical protein LBK18_07980 [Prevotellaceae bacterium]|jgi:hypothetical protein|nr:hypothetical protein [Prevotellaceae bacterium]
MKTKKNTTAGRLGSALPSLTIIFALLGVPAACSDPHTEYIRASTEKSSTDTPTPPESGGQQGETFIDTSRWRGDVAASFTDLGSIGHDFCYTADEQVRISVIRFRLDYPAEMVVSHCGSDLAGATLLLLDSVRQVAISPEESSLPEDACGNPALGKLRVAAQVGVYYAVGYASGVVQVDISQLVGATSPTIISLQTNAVTGTLRTAITCSPLRYPK